MQSEAFKSAEADEVVYPEHDQALVLIGAPKGMRDDFGEHGAAVCGDVRCGTRHISKTGIFYGHRFGLATVSWDRADRSMVFWLQCAFPPARFGREIKTLRTSALSIKGALLRVPRQGNDGAVIPHMSTDCSIYEVC
jgi:hypothetical protein